MNTMQFDPITRRIFEDEQPAMVVVDCTDLLLCVSSLLDSAIRKETPEDSVSILVDLANRLSMVIEDRHPDSEPYFAWLFGMVVFE